jgi:hypothetical protein
LLERDLRNRALDGPFAIEIAVDLNAERPESAELRKKRYQRRGFGESKFTEM